MSEPRPAPFGSWRSPITADLIASATIGLDNVVLDRDDIYWTEMRPAEGGRVVIVHRAPDGATADVIPPPFSARTRVHEYGGGAYTVADGTVYFSSFADQRLHRLRRGRQPESITPEGDVHYADGVVDRRRGGLIAVREDHTDATREPVNTIMAVALDGSGIPRILVRGNDFYAAPRLSPDGGRLAWLTWNHPNMPWDGTELWVGTFGADGAIASSILAAGGPEESIFQPEWSPEGMLHFVSDRSGWWNLYRWRNQEIQPLHPLDAEFGSPQWVLGMSTYAFEAAERIICSYSQAGSSHLARLDTIDGKLSPFELPYTSISGVKVQEGRAVFIGASPTQPRCVVQLDLASGHHEVLRRAIDVAVDAGYLATPKSLEFPTGGGLTAHGFFYGPTNRDYVPPTGERSPLLVMSHGGPTSSTSTALRLGIQFWTSRGYAVLDVDYGGSSGYGRAYRQRLDGQWGIVDVDDCVNGARYLVEQGLVDADRMAITGGSAGGYTTLCALTFRDVFRAGASYYGIGELEALARDTHKFESRYLDRLVGPYPERKDLYRERSPLNFVERLSRPVIFFQGLDDKIVAPNQAEMMVAALRGKGVPVAHLTFEGEQHGFRKAENIQRALEAELYFYSRVFGFEPADRIEPVKIENL